jgi:hypothetical protein
MIYRKYWSEQRMAGEIKYRIEEIKKVVNPEKMVNGAYRVFYSNTPIRSGNARRNTDLRKDEIQANYPYAGRLDEGYSRQSPKGMVEPTIKWLQNYLKKHLGR